MKVFIKYLFIELLEEYIDSLDLIISKEKIYIINIFIFSNNLRKLKIYLNLIY